MMLDATDDTPDSRLGSLPQDVFPRVGCITCRAQGPSQVVVPVTGESIGVDHVLPFYTGLILFSKWLSYTMWTHTANCLVCINCSSPTGKSGQSQGCPFDRSETHGVMVQRQNFDSSLGPRRRLATALDWGFFSDFSSYPAANGAGD